jgi:protease IV
MRRHPVILGLCILAVIGIVFFALMYALSALTGKGGSFNFKDNVGVVNVDGIISDSAEVIEIVEEFSADDGIKAVVIRINSPGGGIAPSQEIYQSIRELRKKKKVVVSMGSVAASGGYLIATAADRIVANPGTITGSISAVMPFVDIQELMKKIGVRSSVIKSGKFKDIGSPVREMTAEERRLLQGVVDDIYDQFIRTVAENRKIPLEMIRKLADGRIFTGRQALSLKLVDELGGLQDAVRIAGRLAGIEGKPAIVYPPKKTTSLWKYLIESAASATSAEIRKSAEESMGTQYLPR